MATKIDNDCLMKQAIAIICLILVSCSSENTSTLIDNSLPNYIRNKTIETGAVIACAGNIISDTNLLEIYFYPEDGSENYKLFQTNSSELDPNDFSSYEESISTDFPFFNGYLKKFEESSSVEKWFIVSFEMDGEIKLSNPIRAKQLNQSTFFTDAIDVNQDNSQMPIFSWDVNSEANNAIFFQVLSTINDDLISGTYTFENQFQYYNTSNVVLNITNGTPPSLMIGEEYKFTVMDVSIDNWVNTIYTKTILIE